MIWAVLRIVVGSPSRITVRSPCRGVGWPNVTSMWLSLFLSNSSRLNVGCSTRQAPQAAAALSSIRLPSSVVPSRT